MATVSTKPAIADSDVSPKGEPPPYFSLMDGATPVAVRPDAIEAVHRLDYVTPNGPAVRLILRSGAALVVTGVDETIYARLLETLAK